MPEPAGRVDRVQIQFECWITRWQTWTSTLPGLPWWPRLLSGDVCQVFDRSVEAGICTADELSPPGMIIRSHALKT